jgi:hypothetical protein
VANNSEIYNYYEWNQKNRASAASHVKQDTREQPKPQQEIEGPSMRLLPAPGGMIVFSGGRHAFDPALFAGPLRHLVQSAATPGRH